MYKVSIYLLGDELDPDSVTALLGLKPDEFHRKGKRWTTSTNREVIERTGIWVVSAKTTSNDLNRVIGDVASKIDANAPFLMQLPGVEEAFLDVFIAIDADTDGGGTCEFELTPQDVAELTRLGLPVRFTVTVVKE